MIACMGSCFAGPSAISQDFFSFNVSISCWVGGFRAFFSVFFETALEDR